MKLTSVVSVVGILFMVSPAQAALSDPEKVVDDFYRGFIDFKTEDVADLINRHVSKPLINSINLSATCNYGDDEGQKECETKCDAARCFYYPVWVETDVNYFTKSQDTYPDWGKYVKTKLIYSNDTTAQVDVTLGRIRTQQAHYTVFLINDNDTWKIWQVDQ